MNSTQGSWRGCLIWAGAQCGSQLQLVAGNYQVNYGQAPRRIVHVEDVSYLTRYKPGSERACYIVCIVCVHGRPTIDASGLLLPGKTLRRQSTEYLVLLRAAIETGSQLKRRRSERGVVSASVLLVV